ncbi:MAG: 50S ribosomal protein L25/general stress protein Ctc [Lachnospiraceae bacterium]
METITVMERDASTKVKKLRRSGMVPCVIYGGALSESISIQMEKTVADKMFKLKREGSKILLRIEEQEIPVQIKDQMRDCLTRELTHISFQALKVDRKVNSVAHILLVNEDKIKGTLEKMVLEIPYMSLPEDMIDTVSIDLDGIPNGSVKTVGDISEFQSKKIELQIETDNIVFRIRDKKVLS